MVFYIERLGSLHELLRIVLHVVRNLFNVPDDSQGSEHADDVVGDVDLPPKEALAGRALIVVMIVVPSFA